MWTIHFSTRGHDVLHGSEGTRQAAWGPCPGQGSLQLLPGPTPRGASEEAVKIWRSAQPTSLEERHSLTSARWDRLDACSTPPWEPRRLERARPVSRKPSPVQALHLSWRLQPGTRRDPLATAEPDPVRPCTRLANWAPGPDSAHCCCCLEPPGPCIQHDSLLRHQPAPRKGCPSIHPGLGHVMLAEAPTPEHSQPPSHHPAHWDKGHAAPGELRSSCHCGMGVQNGDPSPL